MKKILSMVLAVCVLCSLVAVMPTVSAGTISRDLLTQLETMDDDAMAYYCISQPHGILVEYFASWVRSNNPLPDITDYTEEIGDELEAQYLEYVRAKRAEIKASNIAFFEKNFASCDELVHASDSEGYMMVYACKASVIKLVGVPDCYVSYGAANKDTVQRHYDRNNDNYYFREEPWMDPYEVVFALDYYKDYFYPMYLGENYGELDEYMYYLSYSHYPEGKGTSDEATPDYLVVFGASAMCSPAETYDRFGDRYFVHSANIYYPYSVGYHIITTEDMKVYTLKEAWNAELPFMEYVMDEVLDARKRGDANGDDEINIKDATLIQKSLVQLEKLPSSDYIYSFDRDWDNDRVSDMNMDETVNIKDATAIQKMVAGLPYK